MTPSERKYSLCIKTLLSLSQGKMDRNSPSDSPGFSSIFEGVGNLYSEDSPGSHGDPSFVDKPITRKSQFLHYH